MTGDRTRRLANRFILTGLRPSLDEQTAAYEQDHKDLARAKGRRCSVDLDIAFEIDLTRWPDHVVRIRETHRDLDSGMAVLLRASVAVEMFPDLIEGAWLDHCPLALEPLQEWLTDRGDGRVVVDRWVEWMKETNHE